MVIYKHNRSGKFYYFVAEAAHTETKEPLIIYRDFEKSDADVVRTWARPSEHFFEYITMENGDEKPRFEIVEDYSTIFTEEEKEELRKVANGKPCEDGVKKWNAEYFYKWID